MRKNLHEVFDELSKTESREDRVNVLKFNQSFALKSVLLGTFHPNVQFVIDEIPQYKKLDTPIGMGYSTIEQEIARAYLFEKNNPRVSPDLTMERRKHILTQILEALEPKEAEIYAGMLMKRLPVKGLTYDLVRDAFPDLLPKPEDRI